MKKVMSVIVLLMALLLMAGCSGKFIREPSSSSDRLLVGMVNAEVKDHDVLEDDTYEEGIVLTLQDVETEETLTLESNNRGLFFKYNMKPGEYEVRKIEVHAVGEHSIYSYKTTFRKDNFTRFTMDRGEVVNLGVMKWKISEFDSRFGQVGSPEVLYKDLSSRYNESQWLYHEWDNIEF